MPDATPTLYEDWQQRCALLSERPPAGAEAFAPPQVRVLAYLLKRYEGAPEAAQPARYVLPSGLVLKLRNIVVNHHLGQGLAGAKSVPEANDRIARITKRMAAHDAQANIGVPGGGKLAGSVHGQLPLSESLGNSAKAIALDITRVASALTGEQVSAIDDYTKDMVANLPHARRMSLFSQTGHQLKGGTRAGFTPPTLQQVTNFFVRIEDREALGFVHFAWMDALTEHEAEQYLTACELIFCAPFYREDALELLRGDLSNNAPEIRARALMLLARWGTLQEIGLLSDLLNLPPQGDEYEGEREAMLDAMRSLSGALALSPAP